MQDTFESGYTKALLDAQRVLEAAFEVGQGKLTKKHIMSLWAILVGKQGYAPGEWEP